jgi:HlyD family secretion protein
MPHQLNGNELADADIKLSGNTLLRSAELSEIISNKPGFLIRWGISIFFLILLLIVGATFFIHYPDVVSAKAKLTSVNAPKEVKVKTGGKLVKLNTAEGSVVKQNDILGFIESRANHNYVINLSNIVDTMQQFLNENKTAEAVAIFELFTKSQSSSQSDAFPPLLGEIEGAAFIQSFILFKQYLSSGYYFKKKTMLLSDMTYLQRLHTNLLEQKKMEEEDVGLAKETLDANKSLHDDTVISRLDYRNEKSKYIGKAMSIPQITSTIISNESNQHEKQKEILQLENEIAQQKSVFTQALNTLKAQLDEWRNNYLLIAPVDGKIAFAGFVQENQQLRADQTICYVNPENSNYYAEVYIPQNNFGKVKQGQKILLKLPAYPFQEFGALEGRLDFISNIATDSGYIAKVVFTNGLKTNYNKPVQYRDGLMAQGEIITADLKLSDRLLNSIKQIFMR